MLTLRFLLSLVALVLMSGGLVLLAAAQERSSSSWKWQSTDDGWRREVSVKGRAEFNEDYTDVTSLDAGSVVRVEEQHNGETRRYEVRRDGDGPLQRTYMLNGQPHALDADAQHWLGGLLLAAVRQGGLDASTRVARLLRRRGLDGVLSEIEQIEGDYAKRLYFDRLLQTASLSVDERQRTLRAAARDIRGDYERAQFLQHSAADFLRIEALVPVFFDAVDRLGSDYERRRVLTAVLRTPALSQTARRRLLTSAGALSSDYEKATLLISAAPAYLKDADLRAAFDVTVNTIGSDYERGRVRNVLAQRTTSN